MKDTAKFNLGETVYYVANTERKGVVTCVIFSASGVTYGVMWDDLQYRNCYDIELTRERDFKEKA